MVLGKSWRRTCVTNECRAWWYRGGLEEGLSWYKRVLGQMMQGRTEKDLLQTSAGQDDARDVLKKDYHATNERRIRQCRGELKKEGPATNEHRAWWCWEDPEENRSWYKRAYDQIGPGWIEEGRAFCMRAQCQMVQGKELLQMSTGSDGAWEILNNEGFVSNDRRARWRRSGPAEERACLKMSAGSRRKVLLQNSARNGEFLEQSLVLVWGLIVLQWNQFILSFVFCPNKT